MKIFNLIKNTTDVVSLDEYIIKLEANGFSIISMADMPLYLGTIQGRGYIEESQCIILYISRGAQRASCCLRPLESGGYQEFNHFMIKDDGVYTYLYEVGNTIYQE